MNEDWRIEYDDGDYYQMQCYRLLYKNDLIAKILEKEDAERILSIMKYTGFVPPSMEKT